MFTTSISGETRHWGSMWYQRHGVQSVASASRWARTASTSVSMCHLSQYLGSLKTSSPARRVHPNGGLKKKSQHVSLMKIGFSPHLAGESA